MKWVLTVRDQDNNSEAHELQIHYYAFNVWSHFIEEDGLPIIGYGSDEKTSVNNLIARLKTNHKYKDLSIDSIAIEE